MIFMDIPAIFNPKKYVRYAQTKWASLNFRVGRSFVTTTSALGKKIHFQVSSYKEYHMRARLSYVAEKSTMNWIEHFIGPNDIVYDIGANVGAYSLLIGKIMRDHQGKGKVFAFEPESANFYSLNRNIIINKLSDQIIPIPLAFGDRLKLGQFFLSSNVPGSATHGLDEPKSEGIPFEPTHKQGIIAMPLNEFIRLETVDFPNHIKIDVDGLEKTIVENMNDVLADQRLKTVIIEIAELLSKGRIEKMIELHGFHEEDKEFVGSNGQRIFNKLFQRK